MAIFQSRLDDPRRASVIPDGCKIRVKQLPARRAYTGSYTFERKGGTMHGSSQVVTSGNGIGVVPRAFFPA